MKLSRRAILSAALASATTPLTASLATPVVAIGAPPTVRVGTLRFGTASWELDSIRRNGFDRAKGVAVETAEFAVAQATQVALQAGRVDMIVLDWLWVARQRGEGADWTFVPFSGSVGAVVAPPSSPVRSARDLAGARLGIAGSPIDKSWLILQAYARRTLGLDLAKSAKTSFGAPPLLDEQLKAGQLDAVLTFWPYAAKAEAAGMRRILGVEDAVRALGIDARIPFVGYVFSTAWATANRAAASGFFAAARLAQDRLAQSDEEWSALRPITGAANESELDALKQAYRRGIVRKWGDAERAAIDRLYAILAEIGGPALVGSAATIPPGTFWADASWPGTP
jgi:NitT/TauT family transport system substrate-binding protein